MKRLLYNLFRQSLEFIIIIIIPILANIPVPVKAQPVEIGRISRPEISYVSEIDHIKYAEISEVKRIAEPNTYAAGNCTWYAYEKRAEMGEPLTNDLGNANTWALRAYDRGFSVDTVPSTGSVFQTTQGALGHVGIVEAINTDGSILVSEMNYVGLGIVSQRVITNVSSYMFIH